MNLSRPDSIKKLILFSTRHHRHSHLSQSRQMRNSQLSHASIFGRFPWAHTHISGSGRHRICIAECESLCWECENGKNQPRNGKINYEMDKSLERQRRRRSSILVPHTRSLRGDNKIVEVWMGNRMRDSTTLLPPKRCHGFSILDKWFVGYFTRCLLFIANAVSAGSRSSSWLCGHGCGDDSLLGVSRNRNTGTLETRLRQKWKEFRF